MLCLFTAHQFIPPANSEVVWNASKPVFVATLSCFIFQETPTRVTVFGSTWCVAGVVLLGYGSFVNTGPSADTADVTLGMVLTVTGALIHAMMNVGAKVLLKSTSRAKVVTYTYVISAVSAGTGPVGVPNLSTRTDTDFSPGVIRTALDDRNEGSSSQ
ncbi:Hypp5761 [Branchiostoma lanceolatum]|uniref:Hypp5761 protein n=1 Tax=Branchiostoma lanceolatum TaxID=7740 RepID=A0A8J9VH10_BRALA|nr:Hypp5761 [Branchiostoma lanceolatum]